LKGAGGCSMADKMEQNVIIKNVGLKNDLILGN
jgi:hypothetical protein